MVGSHLQLVANNTRQPTERRSPLDDGDPYFLLLDREIAERTWDEGNRLEVHVISAGEVKRMHLKY